MEIDGHEWAVMSKRGEVCGILGCQNEPIVTCLHCGNGYCGEHSGVLSTTGHMNETAAARGG